RRRRLADRNLGGDAAHRVLYGGELRPGVARARRLVGQQRQVPRCGKVFTARETPPPPEPDEEEERRPVRRPVPARREFDEEEYEDERPRRRGRGLRRHYAPHRGTLILVFGILGLVTGLSFVFGPIAWTM